MAVRVALVLSRSGSAAALPLRTISGSWDYVLIFFPGGKHKHLASPGVIGNNESGKLTSVWIAA
ncbi:MAG: hypothetical protein D6753_15780 [Planctomycetota bacterium]|nr:MAG: hypothetical protein D6753_15780 [Planctomycetota bacterium]